MATESNNDAGNDASGVTDGSEHPSTVSNVGKNSTQGTDIMASCDLKCTNDQYIDHRETAKMMMYLIGEQLKYPVQSYIFFFLNIPCV